MADERVKEVEKPKIPEQIKEEYKPRKEGQSTFDKVLEKNRLLQEAPRMTQTTAQKGGPEQETRVARQQEQGERGKDKQSDEKEQQRTKQKAKEERKAGVEIDHKVVGKGYKGSSSDKGGGKGGEGRGFGRPLHRRASVEMLKKGAFTRAAQAATDGSRFATQLKARIAHEHLSREHLQKLVNQIVRFVRSGINKEGDAEVRLDLNEKIFRGLQLRVALKRGKVTIHFNTGAADVRELFTASSGNIQKELEAKGILIHEIKVT